MFNLRSDNEKECAKFGRKLNTLKRTFEIWEEKPQLIYAEELGTDVKEWASTINPLEEFDQIVHIGIGENDSQVSFRFC